MTLQTADSLDPELGLSNITYTAEELLSVIENLREFDPGAASHALMGLLHIAAHKTPSAVEQTAMRIAGLADIVDSHLVLSETGRQVLDPLGSRDAIHHRHALQSFDKSESEVASREARSYTEAFAVINIGGTDYMVGRDEDNDVLAFQTKEKPRWTSLRNTLEHGWSAIAAEILSLTRNATFEYIRMHLIHRKNVATEENVMMFDLYGFEWFLRVENDHVEIRFGGDDWQPADLGYLPADSPNAVLAATALLNGLPDASLLFGRDVEAWALRLAAGALVRPIM
ncbi:MAG: hypothetical protein JJ872_07190 [Marivivens sp.]|nr:hypothetical protein [Marivivens sp.]